MIDREVLEKSYIKEMKTITQIAKDLGSCRKTVSKYLKKYDITADKRDKNIPQNHGKPWSNEDNENLEDWFGVYSLPIIAKKLKRTVRSVETQKNDMELGAAKKATEYVTAWELGQALGRCSTSIINWINKKGLPATKKVVAIKQKCYRIDINKFWKWAKENPKIMRWEMYNRNSLGREPQWLQDELKKLEPSNSGKEYTTLEDLYLTEDYKNGMKLKDMAKKYKREMKSISARLTILKVPRRIVHIDWKPIEDEILLTMRSKGFKFRQIGEELGRTTSMAQNRYNRLTKNKIQA